MRNICLVAMPLLALSLGAFAADPAAKTKPAKTTPPAKVAPTNQKIAPPEFRKAFYPGDFSRATGVTQMKEGLVFFQNAKVAVDITVPKASVYQVSFVGRGTLVDKVGPAVDLIVDGKTLKTFPVQLKVQTYSYAVPFKQGKHSIALAFTNDKRNPSLGEDRNFTLHKIEVISAKLP